MDAVIEVSSIATVIVDDSAEIRLLLRTRLERDPRFTVVAEADDGAGGVEVVMSHQPDLVLLDVSMGKMDGLRALPGIRAGCPSACVVMLSGFPQSTDFAAICLASGADAYLQKGGSLNELIGKVKTIVKDRQQPGAAL